MGTVMLNHYRVQWRFKGSKKRWNMVSAPVEEMVPTILSSALMLQTMRRRVICIESLELTERRQTPLFMGG